MAKHDTLTQCLMHHRTPGKKGHGIDVAWIETKLAKVGLVLKFRDLEGTYEVVEVWSTKPRQDVEAFERCHLHQRSVSDAPRDAGRGHLDF